MIRRQKLAIQFFLVCFIISTLALWFATWYSIREYRRQYLKTLTGDIIIHTLFFRREISEIISDTANYSAVDTICKSLGSQIASRFTVILPSGKVIGDSEGNPDSMENHLHKPEVLQAIKESRGVQRRFCPALRQEMLYVAEPVFIKDSLAAIVRCAVSLESMHKQVRNFYSRVAQMSFIIFILIAFAAWITVRRLSKPINEMIEGAAKFAAGELDFKLPVRQNEEIGKRAEALNTMASTLSERISTITSQRNELTAILNSMAEGVIAVDMNQKIISINPSACRMFGLNNDITGHRLYEVIRNSELQKFLTTTLSSEKIVESTFTISGAGGQRIIQARGTVLRTGGNTAGGAVVVLNDITLIRKLENTRREFIANVSHELRTPLTSIKGFVETIQNGNYSLPQEVTSFLDIVAAKTERLCLMVDDLLTLSSLERDHESRDIVFSYVALNPVLQRAIQTCSAKASSKKISIKLSCPATLKARIHEDLIEQAVVNLIDNAVKYSDSETAVKVSASLEGREVVISVADQGIGIAQEHLSRIFERFYRVDKSRSRKLGGTGLGLSIVKNIAIAHNGSVNVQSTPGKGSIFEIRIPSGSEPTKEKSYYERPNST